MENLLARLESLPSYKELLKESCKTNGIKVSFLITMTLSRAKSIHKKLILTYSPSYLGIPRVMARPTLGGCKTSYDSSISP